MFNYRFTVVAPPSHPEPLAYTMAPRTVPRFVNRFTHARPPVQNGTTPIPATAVLLSMGLQSNPADLCEPTRP